MAREARVRVQVRVRVRVRVRVLSGKLMRFFFGLFSSRRPKLALAGVRQPGGRAGVSLRAGDRTPRPVAPSPVQSTTSGSSSQGYSQHIGLGLGSASKGRGRLSSAL